MINYQWTILELFANNDELVAVDYLLSGSDGINTVKTQGKHHFQSINKSLSDIVESDIIQWIEKDTTIDDVNPIKLAIENQLKDSIKKVDFPWLAGTFTIE